jgi:Holliday junction DNA helicase RuvA
VIARVTGTVAATGKDYVVILVGGVGFLVSVPQTFLNGLSGPGQEVTLHTHLHVRENDLALYGCQSEE